MNSTRNLWKFCSRVRRMGIAMAKEYGLEAFAVIESATYLQHREREEVIELLEARRAARRLTGLTLDRIAALEDAGKDYASVSGLDMKARELAGQYPALGIGQGYSQESAYGHVDHAAKLWKLLRTPDPVIRPQHDESLVREAAELVAGNCEMVPF